MLKQPVLIVIKRKPRQSTRSVSIAKSMTPMWKMATTYTILKRLVPMGTRGLIQDEQVKWLSLRDRCGASQRCLMDVYKCASSS